MEKSAISTQATEKEDLVKPIPKKNWKGTIILAVVAFLVVAGGIGTGYVLSGRVLGGAEKEAAPGATATANEAGLADEETFRDSAEGKLVVGGIEGEGTHHLDRDLGEDKFVYLTSTVIDLEAFVGKKVKVWGETISAKHAGWLMDVGKIKVVD